MKKNTLAFALACAAASAAASAQLHITEYMYSGGGDEFIEFTNTSSGAIDVTGWTYQTASAGSFDISAFGAIGAGESVIITQGDAAFFRDTWGLDDTIKVIGGITNSLSRNDEVTIFDAGDSIIDQLAYGDGDFDGSVRTREYSGNIPLLSLGLNDAYAIVLSATGDEFGSWSSTEFDKGNPGSYIVLPAPSALMAMGLGGALVARRRRSA